MSAAVTSVVDRAEAHYRDLALAGVRRWKEATGGLAIGFLPIWAPREMLHAQGVLPVGLMGGGEDVEIIRGDAFYQSYICHLPRSTVELGLGGQLDPLDGLLFPAICDVIRNLSGVWQLQFPGKLVRYLDVPQNFDPEIGGRFLRLELESLAAELTERGARPLEAEALRASLAAYNANRARVRTLYALREREPWKVPTWELYLILRAGLVLPVEEHTALIREYLAAAGAEERPKRDNCRVVVTGLFCEQPPLNLIKSLELAGCYVVDDDLLLVTRWLTEDVPLEGNPLQNLALAFLHHSESTAAKYEPNLKEKGQHLVRAVRRSGAEGVIFASPSFCDPALLDRPMLQHVLKDAGIPYIAFKYAENSGQMQPIREQAGTFADSIKLWSGT